MERTAVNICHASNHFPLYGSSQQQQHHLGLQIISQKRNYLFLVWLSVVGLFPTTEPLRYYFPKYKTSICNVLQKLLKKFHTHVVGCFYRQLKCRFIRHQAFLKCKNFLIDFLDESGNFKKKNFYAFDFYTFNFYTLQSVRL